MVCAARRHKTNFMISGRRADLQQMLRRRLNFDLAVQTLRFATREKAKICDVSGVANVRPVG
jgi:hypothetical protein